MHQAMAATVEHCITEIRNVQQEARSSGVAIRPRWPMIVLRTPKGWAAPAEVDGHKLEGFWRAHQVPLADVKKNPAQLNILEKWMRAQKPEELFDADGRLIPELRELAPTGIRRMSANPHANGGLLTKTSAPAGFPQVSAQVRKARADRSREHPAARSIPPRRHEGEHGSFPRLRPGREHLQQAAGHLRGQQEVLDRRVLSGRCRRRRTGPRRPRHRDAERATVEGMLEGYLLTGRHGFFSTYEAFVHVIDSMFNQHAKWLSICNQLSWREEISSLNLLITSTVWRQDHNGFTHQDPGFLDVVVNKSAEVTRIYLPPDVNSLLSVADHCLRSENYVNVIVSDKQMHLQYMDMDAAIRHCTKGIGIWDWASNDEGGGA